MAYEKVPVTAEMPVSLLKTLEDLARARGVSADVVVQQAIRTEKFFADAVREGKKVVLENRDGSIERVVFRPSMRT